MIATRRNVLAGVAALPFAAAFPTAAAPAPVDRSAWEAVISAYRAAKAVDDELGDAYLRAVEGFEADVAKLGPKPMGARVSGWPDGVDVMEAGMRELRERVAAYDATVAALRAQHGVDAAADVFDAAPSAADALWTVCETPAPDFPALLEKLDLIEAEGNHHCRNLFEGFAADVRRLAGQAVS